MQKFSQCVHVSVNFYFCKSQPCTGLQDWAVLPRENSPKVLVLVCGSCGCVSCARSAGAGFVVTGTESQVVTQEVRGHEHPAAPGGSAGPWAGK